MNNLNLTRTEPKNLSPLTLAYIGDAVYEILARTFALNKADVSVNKLNREVQKTVNATAQAGAFNILKDFCTTEEAAVLKRGRNAKTASKANSAGITEYRMATGVECLFGYLFLQGRDDRILELFEKIQKADPKALAGRDVFIAR